MNQCKHVEKVVPCYSTPSSLRPWNLSAPYFMPFSLTCLDRTQLHWGTHWEIKKRANKKCAKSIKQYICYKVLLFSCHLIQLCSKGNLAASSGPGYNVPVVHLSLGCVGGLSLLWMCKFDMLFNQVIGLGSLRWYFFNLNRNLWRRYI